MLAQHGLGELAADGGREQARRRPQRVQLCSAPGSLCRAVVEADEAPPRAVDEDRHGRDREDVLSVEHGPLLRGEVAHLAREELVPLPDPREPGEPDLVEAHVLHQRVVELRRGPVRDPLETLARDSLAVGPETALEQVGPARLGRDPEPLEQVVRRVLPARLGDESAGGMADRLQDRVAPAQVALDPLAADPGSDEPRRRAERVGLGRAPVALALAVLEADEAPPAAVDEDGYGDDREHVDELQRLALIGGQLAHVAAERLARGKQARPAREVRRRPSVSQTRIVDRRHGAGRPGCTEERERLVAFSVDVLEHVGAARPGRLAEGSHQVAHRVVEQRLLEEVLGRVADRLEDRVAAAEVALRAAALLVRLGAAEHGRELLGHLAEHGHLVGVPVARPRCVEPEDSDDVPVTAERTSTAEPILCRWSSSWTPASQSSLVTSATTIGPLLEPLDVAGDRERVRDRAVVLGRVAGVERRPGPIATKVTLTSPTAEASIRAASPTISSGLRSSAARPRMPTSSSRRMLSRRRDVTSCMYP